MRSDAARTSQIGDPVGGQGTAPAGTAGVVGVTAAGAVVDVVLVVVLVVVVVLLGVVVELGIVVGGNVVVVLVDGDAGADGAASTRLNGASVDSAAVGDDGSTTVSSGADAHEPSTNDIAIAHHAARAETADVMHGVCQSERRRTVTRLPVTGSRNTLPGRAHAPACAPPIRPT